MKKKQKKQKAVDIPDQLICPLCGFKNTADLWNGTGNYEQDCEDCDAVLSFHATIEFDGISAEPKDELDYEA